jgi:hypothetical protein
MATKPITYDSHPKQKNMRLEKDLRLGLARKKDSNISFLDI